MNGREYNRRNLADLFKGCALKAVWLVLIALLVVVCITAPLLAEVFGK